MSYQKTAWRRHLVTVVKALVSAGAIAFIATRIDFPVFVSHWRKLDASSVLILLAVLAVEVTLVAGTRLKLVLRALGVAAPPLARTSQITLCGFFAEQVAFGFVGGDAMKLWLLHRADTSFRQAIQALILDRSLGLGALLFLVLAGLSGSIALVPHIGQWVIAFICGAVALLSGLIVAFVLLGFTKYRAHTLRVEIINMWFAVIRSGGMRRCLLATFALACVTHLMNVFVFVVVGRNLGLAVTPAQWFFIVPPALLFAMIPVSAGGWGLREGVLILALGRLGIPPEEAIVPSLIFGLGLLLVTLPGALVWLANRRPGMTRKETSSSEAAPETSYPDSLDAVRVPIESAGRLDGQARQ